jgi:hypothetical protein
MVANLSAGATLFNPLGLRYAPVGVSGHGCELFPAGARMMADRITEGRST